MRPTKEQAEQAAYKKLRQAWNDLEEAADAFTQARVNTHPAKSEMRAAQAAIESALHWI